MKHTIAGAASDVCHESLLGGDTFFNQGQDTIVHFSATYVVRDLERSLLVRRKSFPCQLNVVLVVRGVVHG